MHGSPFTSARIAINEAKEKKRRIAVRTPDHSLNYQINIIFDLMMFMRNNQTLKQLQTTKTVDYYNIKNQVTQKEIAEKLRVSPAMVSKTLTRTGYDLINKGRKLIIELLSQSLDNHPSTNDS